MHLLPTLIRALILTNKQRMNLIADNEIKDQVIAGCQQNYTNLQSSYLLALEDVSRYNKWQNLSSERKVIQSMSYLTPHTDRSAGFRIYRELRSIYKIYGIETVPMDLHPYQQWFNNSIAPNIRRNSGHSNWRMMEDENYWTCSYDDLEQIVMTSWVPDLTYTTDRTDCDFFVREFKSELERDYGINNGAQVTGQSGGIAHRLLSVKCHDIPAIVDITRTRKIWPHSECRVPMARVEDWMSYDG